MIPIDSLPVNIAIYRYENGDFIIVDFNLQAQKTDSVLRKDIIGKNVEEVFPGVREFGLLDIFKRVYKSGKPEHHKAAYYRDEIRQGWRVNEVSRLDNGHIMAVYEDATAEIITSNSLESLGKLIDKSINEIYIVDPETLLFYYANESALHNIGYTMEELLHMTPSDINSEYGHKEIRSHNQPLLDETIPLLSIETKNRRKDGTEYDAEVRIQKMLYEGKERLVVNIIDISDRIKNQQEMLKLYRIIEQSDDLIMITDCNGIIEYVNDAYIKLTGWNKEDFIKARPSLMKSGNSSAEFYKSMWEMILLGKTYKGSLQNRKKDNSLYWEEKTITPIKLIDNQITHFISTGKDITEQRKLREALEESEILFKTLTESALAGIFLYRENILYVNQAFAKMTGYSFDELKRMTPMDLVAPQERDFIEGRVQSGLKGELQDKIAYEDLKIVTRAGEVRWYYIAISTVKFQGEWTGLGTAIDMTDRKIMEKQLEYVAQTDALTGLYNRLKFDDIIQREIAFGKRQNSQLSIIYMDIDFFKNINDTYGHDIGDAVLKKLAFIIQEVLRVSDYSFRWGGEEFLIVCPNTTINDVKILAERLRESVAQNNFSIGTKVTVSIGITQYHDNELVDEMIKRADEALYQAKESGRNRVVENMHL